MSCIGSPIATTFVPTAPAACNSCARCRSSTIAASSTTRTSTSASNKEPIRSNGDVVGYVTSAGFGYSIGRCVAYGYLPTELAVEGTPLEIEYFDERLPARVASEPLWDPKGERLRG